MKIQSLFMTLLMLLMAAGQVSAQKTLKSGKVTFDMKAETDTDNEMMKAQMDMMFADASMEITFDESRTLVYNKMGAMSTQVNLTNHKTGDITLLMDIPMAGMKTLVKTNKEEMEEFNDSDEKMEWKLDDKDTKEILGYTCMKASSSAGEQGDVTIYYTKDIAMPNKINMMSIKDLPFKGFPLLITVSNPAGFEMVMKAKELSKKVEKDAFELDSEDYEEMDFEEFQESMRGMGGGR